MSRLDWDDIWQFHFGDVESVKCPCCDKNTIQHSIRNWERGHIIPARKHGPDIYENVRPICKTCNEKDRKYDSNFHYMAIQLKRITIQEANEKVTEIWRIFDYQRKNPDMTLCVGIVQKTGKPCICKRKPNSLFCMRHEKKSEDHLLNHSILETEKQLDLLWDLYYVAGMSEETELVKMLVEDISEMTDWLSQLKAKNK